MAATSDARKRHAEEREADRIRETLVEFFHDELPRDIHARGTVAQCETWADAVLDAIAKAK